MHRLAPTLVDCFKYRDKLGLDITLERYASLDPANESAIEKSLLSHACCRKIESWRHTWKAQRETVAEEYRSLIKE
jgi:hypothetical protein